MSAPVAITLMLLRVWLVLFAGREIVHALALPAGRLQRQHVFNGAVGLVAALIRL